MSERNKREWLDSHYRKSMWHESIRMAIACDKDVSIIEKLLEIEQNSLLPNGCFFLASEGVGERNSSKVPQALYDKLLEYLRSDNPHLSNKAAKAIWLMEGKSIDWQKKILLELIKSDIEWIHDGAYSVYLRLSEGEQDYEIIRDFIIDYSREPDKGFHNLTYNNMEETVKRLRTNERDINVIDAIKHIYYDHCTVAGKELLRKYLEQVGEEKWVIEYNRQKNSPLFNFDFNFTKANNRLRNSEWMLIQTLADVYGTTEVQDPVEICLEYSKLVQVINLMGLPIGELIVLQLDLPKEYSKSILNASCIAGGIQVDRLKQEIYSRVWVMIAP
jgi:hypothetical protein